MWRYIGPYLDPHRFVYHPGMLRQVHADDALKLMDSLLAKDAEPGAATSFSLARDGGMDNVLVYKHDGVACGFTCYATGEMTGQQLVDGARQAFPELFRGHKMPFAVIQDAPPCAPSKSDQSLSGASASSTSRKAAGSPPAKPSAKSSA